MPVSSCVSLRAHSCGLSPSSIFPPGKHISPGWDFSLGALTSNSRQRPYGFSTRGMVTLKNLCLSMVPTGRPLSLSSISFMFIPFVSSGSCFYSQRPQNKHKVLESHHLDIIKANLYFN